MTVAPAATSATPSARWGVTKTAQRPLTPSLAGSSRGRQRFTDADDRARSCLSSALESCLPIDVEGGISQVGVTVDK